MKQYQVSIQIVPRKGLLDPQGKAVTDALHTLGFTAVSDVHVGRLIVVETSAANVDAAKSSATEMCTRLLANPVTEDFVIASVQEVVTA